MKAPTAVVAEDEAALREQLVEQLHALWPELRVAGVAADGIEALRLLEDHRPDILFLDIQMPGASGQEVARAAAGRCHIVFVTAFDQHAVEAFEHGAIDYVLKPVLPARLFSTISRLKERLASGAARPEAVNAVIGQLGGAATHPTLRWINASVGQNLRVITVDEVLYFQADNKYTRVVTDHGEALIRKSLKELVDELDPQQFWQIHRSTLVNAAAIDRIARDMRGRMVVHVKGRGDTLLVSDSYAHLFRQM
ncbi:MAG TPA: LytTR family DNA-binding domain-containing protein [Burkholderiaceae bacterium]|jgi:DNA-binding LytR/AlgR family response regulator|nr:LytTR family DNA-binding domain-containing protein [Burkholderiaceae bacterium]